MCNYGALIYKGRKSEFPEMEHCDLLKSEIEPYIPVFKPTYHNMKDFTWR